MLQLLLIRYRQGFLYTHKKGNASSPVIHTAGCQTSVRMNFAEYLQNMQENRHIAISAHVTGRLNSLIYTVKPMANPIKTYNRTSPQFAINNVAKTTSVDKAQKIKSPTSVKKVLGLKIPLSTRYPSKRRPMIKPQNTVIKNFSICILTGSIATTSVFADIANAGHQ